jgi:hypothetical protein
MDVSFNSPLVPFQPTLKEIAGCPEFTSPLSITFEKFSGDEIFILAKVCKIWNQLLLKPVLEKLTAFLPEYKRLIWIASEAIAKNKTQVESEFLKILVELKNDGSSPLDEVENIPYLTAETPQYFDKIMMQIASEVAELTDSQFLLISNKIEENEFSPSLKESFYYCVNFKWLEKEDSEEKKTKLMLHIQETPCNKQLFSKMTFLKRLPYNSKEKAFEKVTRELMENKYFYTAFNFARSKGFIDDVGLELASMLIEIEEEEFREPLIQSEDVELVEHLIENEQVKSIAPLIKNPDADAICVLIKHMSNPKLKAEILAKALIISFEKVLCHFGSADEIFNIFSVNEEEFYVTNTDATLIVFKLLIESGAQWGKTQHILDKVDCCKQAHFFRIIAQKLNDKGFTEEAGVFNKKDLIKNSL